MKLGNEVTCAVSGGRLWEILSRFQGQRGKQSDARAAKAKKHLRASFARDTGFLAAFVISAFGGIVVWLGLRLISR
jgi:hypothetical protein